MVSKKNKRSLKSLKFGLLAVAVTVCFVGCSKDDDCPTCPEYDIPNHLIGEWANVYPGFDTNTKHYRGYVFNSNRTIIFYSFSTHNDNEYGHWVVEGTFSMYRKDIVIANFTQSKDGEDTYNPIDAHNMFRFKTGSDEKGNYLMLVAPNYDFNENDKFYKK